MIAYTHSLGIPLPPNPLLTLHAPLIIVPRPPRRRTEPRSRLSLAITLSIIFRLILTTSGTTPTAFNTYAPTSALKLQHTLAVTLNALNLLPNPTPPPTSIRRDLHTRPIDTDTARQGFALEGALPFSRVRKIQAATQEGMRGVELGHTLGGVGGGGEDGEAGGAGAAVGGDVGAGGDGDGVKGGGDGAGDGG